MMTPINIPHSKPRGKRGTYVYRRSIPKELRESVGQSEYVISLKTSNPVEAAPLAIALDEEHTALFKRLKRQLAEGRKPVDPLAAFNEVLAPMVRDRVNSFLNDDDFLGCSTEALEEYHWQLQQCHDRLFNLPELGDCLLDIHLVHEGATMTLKDSMRRFCGWVESMPYGTSIRLWRRVRGLFDEATKALGDGIKEELENASPAGWEPRQLVAAAAVTKRDDSRGRSLRVILKEYLGLNTKRAPSAIQGMTSDLDLFLEFCQKSDMAVTDVTKAMLTAFRDDCLVKLPAQRHRKKELKGKSLSECIRITEKEGFAKLTPVTIHGRFKTLRTLLEHAKTEGDIQRNPAANIKAGERMKVIAGGGMMNKKAFTADETEEMKKLIGDESFNIWLETPDFKWITAIGYHQGMRLGEVTQLQSKDVYLDQSSGAYVISINDDHEKKSLKKQSSRRIIPLHPELRKMGFLEYIDAKGMQPDDFIWSQSLSWEPKCKWYGKYTSTYRRKIAPVAVPDADRRRELKGYHSLRHSAISRMLANGIPEDERKGIVGHSAGDVHAGYAGGITVQQMAKWMTY